MTRVATVPSAVLMRKSLSWVPVVPIQWLHAGSIMSSFSLFMFENQWRCENGSSTTEALIFAPSGFSLSSFCKTTPGVALHSGPNWEKLLLQHVCKHVWQQNSWLEARHGRTQPAGMRALTPGRLYQNWTSSKSAPIIGDWNAVGLILWCHVTFKVVP